MSTLSLTKDYADLAVLFEVHLSLMWDELEAKTNGTIDDDVVASGWGHLGQLTVRDDTPLYFGATASAYIDYEGATNIWTFGNTEAGADTIFKVEGTQVAKIEATSNDLESDKDIMFAHRSTTFSLSRILAAYQKPNMGYVSATTFLVENNTETANTTLIVFPSGPVAVTEDTGVTTKFRLLDTAATANGYDAAHTGAADSGLRVGLTLAANTWYFVYAARVRYGDDAGNNFILALDDTAPTQGNESTLNTRYGTSEWVYLGTIRRGYGDYSTTTVIPFVQDHQGWTFFTSNASASGVSAAGIQVFTDTTFSATTLTTLYTVDVANSGDSVPTTAFQLQLNLIVRETDGIYHFVTEVQNSSANILWTGPSFYTDVDRKDGYCFRMQAQDGAILAGKCPVVADAIIHVTITGFQDHYV